MSLLAFLTFLTFFNANAPRIISLVISLTFHDRSVRMISSEIFKLRKELNSISIVDEFAKHAKLQRKISKLQDEQKILVADYAARAASLKQTALYVTYGITSVILLVLISCYHEETIAELPSELLWPVPYFFSWFSNKSGCISVFSWVLISSQASNILAKYY